MKKVFIIFILLLSAVSFADNSIELKNEEVLNLISKFETELNVAAEDQKCYATCSVSIINSETGETKTFTAIGYSDFSCDLAGASCLRNARSKALVFMEAQNEN